jgi:hypothetical protein
MMSDKTNTAHVKLVDFGLAKIIGPEDPAFAPDA